MKRFPATGFLILLLALAVVPAGFAQQDLPEGNRKITSRVTPQYPDLARTMHLEGSVKAEAVVDSNGKVKAVEMKGGHPLLVRAAQDAIQKWRWAPAPHETREPIEVKFDLK